MQHLSQQKKENDVFNILRRGFVFYGKHGRRFVLINKLGEGGMGVVFKAEDLCTHAQYAVKCEKYSERRARKGLRIAMEKLIMKTCKRSAHIPDYTECGRTHEFGWIAMELVGESLGALRRLVPNKTFSTITVLRIAIEVTKGLRDLHGKGFVHRDLKPDNLAIGHGNKRNKIYILDLGIARQYKNVKGVPHRPRLQVKFKGTRHFAPLALQKKEEYGPKDDIESLFYILALLHVGRLPWSQFREDHEIIRIKESCRRRPQHIFGDSHEFGELLAILWGYTTAMSYEDTIDYAYLVDAFSKALNRLSTPANFAYDWERLEPTATPARTCPVTTPAAAAKKS